MKIQPFKVRNSKRQMEPALDQRKIVAAALGLLAVAAVRRSGAAAPLASLLALGATTVGFLATGFFLRVIPRWQRFGTWLLLGSPLTLVLLVLFFLTFQYDAMAAGVGVAGLTERILVTEVQALYVAMGWLTFRHSFNGHSQ